KAGIMEIADVFIINESDRPGVERVERAVQMMLSLSSKQADWIPPIIKTVATKGEGIDEAVAAIESSHQFFQNSPARAERRREAARQRLLTLLRDRLLGAALENAFGNGELNRIVNQVADRDTD